MIIMGHHFHHPTWIQTGVGQQTPVIITSQHYVCTVYCVLWTVHTLHARRRHQSSPPQHSEQSICKYAVKQLSAEWDTDTGTTDKRLGLASDIQRMSRKWWQTSDICSGVTSRTSPPSQWCPAARRTSPSQRRPSYRSTKTQRKWHQPVNNS